MAFVFVTEDRILDAITEKTDKSKMKSIMDSAGDDVRWNINDKDRKNGKIVAWPLMAAGKPTKKNPTGTKPIVIKTDEIAIKAIQTKYRNDTDHTGGKVGEINFTINGVQQVTFRKETNLKPDPRVRTTNSLKEAEATRLQELGSAYIFDLAINQNKVYGNWKDIKTKDGGEAYEGLKRIWWENYRIPDVEDEWIQNFYKQHKALLPKVGNSKFDDVNREGGFMDFITDFVLDEFGHLLGGKKDSWNPADIWLIKNEASVIQQIKREVGGTGNSASKAIASVQLKQLNQIFRQLYKQNIVMGISLKKVTGTRAKYVTVNISQKFMNKVGKISELGSYTVGKGSEKPQCKLDTKDDNGGKTFETQDTRLFVDARGTLYNFQIKQNSTSSSLKYDNLKFEPTAKGAGAARIGKAPVHMVMALLKAHGIDFKNNHNDKEYPRSYDGQADGFTTKSLGYEEKYKQKLERISKHVTLGVDVDQAVQNLKLIFMSENAPDTANSKCMQITFLDEFFKKDEKTRNQIGTDMVFLASKIGARFGPHGKIY